MGEQITVRSPVGQESVFAFAVNLEVGESMERPKPGGRVVALTPDQLRYRLLVVEENKKNRYLQEELLRLVGFDVRTSKNGKEGVSVWQEWDPHLILMDIRMPVMDGVEATKNIKVRAEGSAPAIIAVTASAFQEQRSTIFSAGCDGFTRKPIREEALYTTIAEHLNVQYVFEPISSSTPRDQNEKPSLSELLAGVPTDWVEKVYRCSRIADHNSVVVHIEQSKVNIPF